MRKFDDLLAMAAEKKGSFSAVLDPIERPIPSEELSAISDDRWLSMMTKCIFRAGFSWKVIERKWDGFEATFDGFSVTRCAMMDDAWLDELVADTRIVRNGQKIQAVQANAAFVSERSQQARGFGRFIAVWSASDYIGLVQVLKALGSRLGGTTGQYLLRNMGKESFHPHQRRCGASCGGRYSRQDTHLKAGHGRRAGGVQYVAGTVRGELQCDQSSACTNSRIGPDFSDHRQQKRAHRRSANALFLSS